MRIHDPSSGESYIRKLRKRYDDGAPRELTFTCFRRLGFLARDRSRQWLVDAIERQRSLWPIDVWAYVIMPEHVHLLVAPRDPGAKVGLFAGRIKEEVARQGVAWLERNSPDWIPKITVTEGPRTRRRFWQPEGGFDRNVEQLSTLESMIAYIHSNPVRRKLVERDLDWEWSSARWYAGLRPVPLEMDRTLPTFRE
jgi:putative transposase